MSHPNSNYNDETPVADRGLPRDHADLLGESESTLADADRERRAPGDDDERSAQQGDDDDPSVDIDELGRRFLEESTEAS